MANSALIRYYIPRLKLSSSTRVSEGTNAWSTYTVKRHFFRHGRRTAPTFARMCGLRRDWLSPKKIDPPHPILIETHSYRRPSCRRLQAVRPKPAAVDTSAMRRFASLFGEVLLYQHQRIVTMTKGYMASNNLPVEIIRFHTIIRRL